MDRYTWLNTIYSSFSWYSSPYRSSIIRRRLFVLADLVAVQLFFLLTLVIHSPSVRPRYSCLTVRVVFCFSSNAVSRCSKAVIWPAVSRSSSNWDNMEPIDLAIVRKWEVFGGRPSRASTRGFDLPTNSARLCREYYSCRVHECQLTLLQATLVGDPTLFRVFKS